MTIPGKLASIYRDAAQGRIDRTSAVEHIKYLFKTDDQLPLTYDKALYVLDERISSPPKDDHAYLSGVLFLCNLVDGLKGWNPAFIRRPFKTGVFQFHFRDAHEHYEFIHYPTNFFVNWGKNIHQKFQAPELKLEDFARIIAQSAEHLAAGG